MSRVVAVPEEMDHRGFEELLVLLDEAFEEGADRILLNAKHVRWVSPYGLIGLLAVGRVILDRTGNAPSIEAPESRDVRSYWDFMGFWQAASGIFDVPSVPPRIFGPHDALLEITSIRSHRDVHSVVERVRERAASILEKRLHYPKPAVIQFSVMLSEVCQNIIEHAEAPGWVAAQTYNWARRLGRHVLVIAVTDLGRGFRGSLADEHAARFGDRWADATALEAAFIHGLTRFPDSGRGQGIQQIRKQVRRWDGSISIRSGTARIADVPEWDDAPPLADGLAPFPGAQINIVLPARARENE